MAWPLTKELPPHTPLQIRLYLLIECFNIQTFFCPAFLLKIPFILHFTLFLEPLFVEKSHKYTYLWCLNYFIQILIFLTNLYITGFEILMWIQWFYLCWNWIETDRDILQILKLSLCLLYLLYLIHSIRTYNHRICIFNTNPTVLFLLKLSINWH